MIERYATVCGCLVTHMDPVDFNEGDAGRRFRRAVGKHIDKCPIYRERFGDWRDNLKRDLDRILAT